MLITKKDTTVDQIKLITPFPKKNKYFATFLDFPAIQLCCWHRSISPTIPRRPWFSSLFLPKSYLIVDQYRLCLVHSYSFLLSFNSSLLWTLCSEELSVICIISSLFALLFPIIEICCFLNYVFFSYFSFNITFLFNLCSPYVIQCLNIIYFYYWSFNLKIILFNLLLLSPVEGVKDTSTITLCLS